jgi:hypothetical protein
VEQMMPLSGAMVKVDRVKEQLELLMLECSAFLKNDAYLLRQEVDNDVGEYVLFFDPGDLRPPLSWSVRIGEMLYDLRSALDHFVWELVIHDGGKPSQYTEFPIFDREDKYLSDSRGGGLYKLRGVGEKGLAFIKRLQPYHTANNPKVLHPLWVLHNLSIIDKHRFLHLSCTVCRLGKLRFKIVEGRGGGSVNFAITDAVRLKGRTEVARISLAADPDTTMQVEFPHTPEVTFDDAPLVGRRPVREVFVTLGEETEKILAAGQRELFS